MKKPVKRESWHPPDYNKSDVFAVKALAAGNASDHQQKQALRWIVNQACGTYDLSFRPESERATCLAEGRRFVGLQIVKLLNLTGSAMDLLKD